MKTLSRAKQTHGTIHGKEGSHRQGEGTEIDPHMKHPRHGEPTQERKILITFGLENQRDIIL